MTSIQEIAASLCQIVEEIFSKTITYQHEKQIRHLYESYLIVRESDSVSLEFYQRLDLIPTVIRLEKLADYIGRKDVASADLTLDLLEEVISIYIELFSFFAEDYSDSITIPTKGDLRFLLEIDSDEAFEILLIGFARTRDPIVKRFLDDFAKDEEEEVAVLAETLLSKYYNDQVGPLVIQIRLLVESDKTLQALNTMLRYTEQEKNIELQNGVRLLKSQYSRVLREFEKNLLTRRERDVTLNRLNNSILLLLLELG